MKNHSSYDLKKRSLKTTTAALLTVLMLVALPLAAVFADITSYASPTANTNPPSLDEWDNPANAYVSDNVYASANGNLEFVKYHGFTFDSIPAGSRIDGIEVDIEGYKSTTRDVFVSLSWDGGTTFTSGTGGTKEAVLPVATDTDTYVTVGGPTDTWGTDHTWVAGDFAGSPSTFWVYLITENMRSGVSYVDHLRVRVHYTPLFTLTYNAGTGGTITGDTSQEVFQGDDGTAVTAVANTGYHFTGWSDGVLTATRTDLNITANLTVTANFAINQYTLTYNAGTGGSITGPSPQTVNHGENGTTVTAVPNGGYYFTGWSDGVLTAARTDNNVTGDITVTANFSPLGNFQGWAGSAAITSNRPVVSVARPHVGAEIASYDGMTGGGLKAYVPMLFKNAFGGSYDAAFYVQNMAATTADITIKFYDSTGAETCTQADTLAPLASKGWWLPSLPGACLPDGWVGGAVVTSNKNVVAVGRPHVGSEVMTYNGFNAGTLTSHLPMLFKKGFGGIYDSAFYVQNVGAVNANVTIKFYDEAGTESCVASDTIAPLASKGFWLPSVICDTGSLPVGWVGGAVVTSNQPVVTIGRPHVGAQVTSYAGLPAGGHSMYVPMLFRKGFGGTYNAAFYVQNVDAGNADVTIKFYDSAGNLSCTVNDTIAPLASKGWWLPNVTCDTGSLPDGWVGGAVVTSAQNLVAVGRPHIGAQVTTYPGIASGGTNLALPMLFKDAFGGSYDSAFYVQNTDAANAADITVKFYNPDGSLVCQRTDTIPALATLGYWLPSVTCE